MPLTTTSYTLTCLSDAPSYQLHLSMTGSPQGILNISFHKNGALHAASVYVQARSWDGSSWAQSGAGGMMSGGVRTYSYSSAAAFDVQVYTNASKTELLGTSFVSFGATGPRGSDGIPGIAAKDFSVIASSPTFTLSSRGITLSEQAVILACSLLNIAFAEVTVQWTVSEGASLIVQQGLETTLIIPACSQAVSVQVTCTVTGYGSKSLVLKGVRSGAEAPVYLGVLASSDPSIDDHFTKAEGRFIKGDFFLYSTLAGNFPKWYNGASWAAVDGDTPNYSQICSATLADSLRQPASVLSTSAIFGFFRTLVANNAFITEFGSQLIRILKDGMIRTDDFATDPATGRPASGFCLDNPVVDPETGERRGRIRAGNAMFVDSILYGRIIHDLLTTQEASPSTMVTIPDAEGWSAYHLIEALSTISADTLLGASGTYGGSAIQGVLRKTTADNLHLFSTFSSGTVTTQTYTVPFTGTVHVRAILYTHTLPPVTGYGGVGSAYYITTIHHNGVKLPGQEYQYATDWKGFEADLSVQKGDMISFSGYRYVNMSEAMPTGPCLVAEKGQAQMVAQAGTYLQYGDSYNRIAPGVHTSPTVSLASPILWESSSNWVCSGAKILAQCTGLTRGVTLGASGTVTIDGVARAVTSVSYTGISITLHHNGGSREIVAHTQEPSTEGWYRMGGSFTPNSTASGVLVKDIYPKENAQYYLGSIDKSFKAAYANTFNATSKRSLKKNIRRFRQSALEILSRVEVVSYQYKTETGGYEHTGFIADDAPSCLTGAGHDVMALSDNVGMLIRAVQELDARISQLEAP